MAEFRRHIRDFANSGQIGKKLIAGPRMFICDDCVEVCNDIIADDTRYQKGGATANALEDQPHNAERRNTACAHRES